MAATLGTIKQKVGFIYFRGRKKKLRSFVPRKKGSAYVEGQIRFSVGVKLSRTSSSPHLMGSSDSSLSYWSLNVLAKKKMTPEATSRNPATEAMAMPTTSGSDTYSSQCSPRYHQFSPTRHLTMEICKLILFFFWQYNKTNEGHELELVAYSVLES